MEKPLVPPAYRSGVDLRDPKTLETFRRTWMEYPELKQWQVDYIVLPSAGYRRFLDGRAPPPGTAAHYYFTRSRDYIRQFFDPANPRYEMVEEFVDGGSTISVFKVL